MDYVGQIFRPPSEANSLLLQVTVGCSHNGCTYCAMYRDPEQKFRIKNWSNVVADIEQASHYVETGATIKRVFLCDGDALILSTAKLEKILRLLKQKIPTVHRIGIYGDARSILRKSVEELIHLRELGLGIVYHGVESGDDKILQQVNKGADRHQTQQAAHRLKTAGIRHSVIIMLGLGGTENSVQHAEATASLLTEMDPPYVGALTTTLIPGTQLHAESVAGDFHLPDRWGMLSELLTLIEKSQFTRCRFFANHASNYLPLKLNLPVDRDRALQLLRKVLHDRDDSRLVPDYMRGL